MINIRSKLLYFAWFQALLGLVLSLYFSEIAKLPPCALCWYQRIFLYPLCLIIPIGILTKDKRLPLIILPLSLMGLVVSVYHNLLYYGIIPETIAPCQAGVSCTTKLIEWFGFITIPLMSFVAFLTITLSMLMYLKLNKKSTKK